MSIDITEDFHMHTRFSDGKATIDEMADAAVEKGLSQICITDHMPLPEKKRYTMGKEKVDEYRLAVREARIKYADRLKINMGIECEFIPERRFWVKSIMEMGWDCAIVSVHCLCVNNALYLVNGTRQEFEAVLEAFRHDVQALVRFYYKTLQDACDTGWFDITGHLDVIKKHNPDEIYFCQADTWYRRLVLETLDIIKHRGMKMEINMSGLEHPVKEPYPSPWVIEEARKRQIPLVLGSDAHHPESVGRHFDLINLNLIRGESPVRQAAVS